MSIQRVIIALGVLAACMNGNVLAQIETTLGSSHTGASSAAYYSISKPGEITISINLWGQVRNPGRYEVPISTDIVQLISYAGGPLAEANLSSVRVAREVRREGANRTVEFLVNLDKLDKIDEKARKLEPSDTIVIEAIGFSWRDAFNVVTTAAIITAAVANAVIALR
jgi:protein involved in polysaccharide export with SLBB domain